MAQHLKDPVLLLEANMARGTIIAHEGELVVARNHLEQAIRLYRLDDHHTYVARSGIDPGVNSYSRLSWVLWFLGYPSQALDASQHSVALARQLGHANSLGMSCNFSAMLYQFYRQYESVREQAEIAMTVSTEHNLIQLKKMATILYGCYLAHVRQNVASIAQMQQELAAYRTSGTELYYEWFLALLAEAYSQDGQSASGLVAITEAIAWVRGGTWPWWEAEMLRLKGQLLLQQSSDNAAEAETYFHEAISIAQNQSAKSWELRAATSLAHLWQSQGKRDQAYDLLALVYRWFTEGFDTADLQDAQALLDELGG